MNKLKDSKDVKVQKEVVKLSPREELVLVLKNKGIEVKEDASIAELCDAINEAC